MGVAQASSRDGGGGAPRADGPLSRKELRGRPALPFLGGNETPSQPLTGGGQRRAPARSKASKGLGTWHMWAWRLLEFGALGKEKGPFKHLGARLQPWGVPQLQNSPRGSAA